MEDREMVQSLGHFRSRNRNVAIITADENAIITTVNQHTCHLFGYSADQLIGKSVKVLMADPYREQHDSYVRRYVSTGQKNVMHTKRAVECVTNSGETFSAYLALSEVRNASGRFFLGALTAIEQYAAEVDADLNGTILTCNDFTSTLFGYSREELVGQNVSMFAPEAHACKHASYISNYLRTGRKHVIDKTRNVSGKHKDGTLLPVALQVTERYEQDRLIGFHGRLTPVKEVDAVLTLTADGAIKSASVRSSLMFGFSREELMSKKIGDLIPQLHDKQDLVTLLQAGAGSVVGPISRVVMARHKDSSRFKVNMSVKSYMAGSTAASVASDGGAGASSNSNSNNSSSSLNNTNSTPSVSSISPMSSSGSSVTSSSAWTARVASATDASTATTATTAPMGGAAGAAGAAAAAAAAASPLGGGAASASSSQQMFSVRLARECAGIGVDINIADEEESAAAAAIMIGGRWARVTPAGGGGGLLSSTPMDATPLGTSSSMQSTADDTNSTITTETGGANGGTTRRDSSVTSGSTSSSTTTLGGRYRVVGSIAKGGFGHVFFAREMNTNQPVAIKSINKSALPRTNFEYSDDLGRHIPKEIAMLRLLSHDNIIKMLDVIETSNCFFLVMEYGAGSDLFDRLKKLHRFSEMQARFVMKQVVAALIHCHALGICHRDIKHENVLFMGPLDGPMVQAWTVKIVDFGLSCFMAQGERFNEFAGTAVFAAPEVLLGMQYDPRPVEVWSLGVLLYGMVVGVLPFDQLDQAVRGEFSIPDWLSPDCQNLLRETLQVASETRPSLETVLNHPWMKTVDPINKLAELAVPADQTNQSSSSTSSSSPQNVFTRDSHSRLPAFNAAELSPWLVTPRTDPSPKEGGLTPRPRPVIPDIGCVFMGARGDSEGGGGGGCMMRHSSDAAPVVNVFNSSAEFLASRANNMDGSNRSVGSGSHIRQSTSSSDSGSSSSAFTPRNDSMTFAGKSSGVMPTGLDNINNNGENNSSSSSSSSSGGGGGGGGGEIHKSNSLGGGGGSSGNLLMVGEGSPPSFFGAGMSSETSASLMGGMSGMGASGMAPFSLGSASSRMSISSMPILRRDRSVLVANAMFTEFHLASLQASISQKLRVLIGSLPNVEGEAIPQCQIEIKACIDRLASFSLDELRGGAAFEVATALLAVNIDIPDNNNKQQQQQDEPMETGGDEKPANNKNANNNNNNNNNRLGSSKKIALNAAKFAAVGAAARLARLSQGQMWSDSVFQNRPGATDGALPVGNTSLPRCRLCGMTLTDNQDIHDHTVRCVQLHPNSAHLLVANDKLKSVIVDCRGAIAELKRSAPTETGMLAVLENLMRIADQLLAVEVVFSEEAQQLIRDLSDLESSVATVQSQYWMEVWGLIWEVNQLAAEKRRLLTALSARSRVVWIASESPSALSHASSNSGKGSSNNNAAAAASSVGMPTRTTSPIPNVPASTSVPYLPPLPPAVPISSTVVSSSNNNNSNVSSTTAAPAAATSSPMRPHGAGGGVCPFTGRSAASSAAAAAPSLSPKTERIPSTTSNAPTAAAVPPTRVASSSTPPTNNNNNTTTVTTGICGAAMTPSPNVTQKQAGSTSSNIPPLPPAVLSVESVNLTTSMTAGEAIGPFRLLSRIGRTAFLARNDEGGGGLFVIEPWPKNELWRFNSPSGDIVTMLRRKILEGGGGEFPVLPMARALHSRGNVFAGFPFYVGGSLALLLRKMPILPTEVVRHYLCELVCALRFLHSNGIVHRRLRPSAILIDDHGHLKLRHFGESLLGMAHRREQLFGDEYSFNQRTLSTVDVAIRYQQTLGANGAATGAVAAPAVEEVSVGTKRKAREDSQRQDEVEVTSAIENKADNNNNNKGEADEKMMDADESMTVATAGSDVAVESVSNEPINTSHNGNNNSSRISCASEHTATTVSPNGGIVSVLKNELPFNKDDSDVVAPSSSKAFRTNDAKDVSSSVRIISSGNATGGGLTIAIDHCSGTPDASTTRAAASVSSPFETLGGATSAIDSATTILPSTPAEPTHIEYLWPAPHAHLDTHSIPYYSPEVLLGSPLCGTTVEAAGDYWALGVLLFRCLVGHVPFVAPTAEQTFLAVVSSDSAAMINAIPLEKLAPSPRQVLIQLMSHNPSERLNFANNLEETEWVTKEQGYSLSDSIHHAPPIIPVAQVTYEDNHLPAMSSNAAVDDMKATDLPLEAAPVQLALLLHTGEAQ